MLGYNVLKKLAPGGSGFSTMDGGVYHAVSKAEKLLGRATIDALSGLTVLDFGCGEGDDTISIAQCGARHVVGLDIQERFLTVGRQRAVERGVADKVTFTKTCESTVDAVISIDAFEHFDDPAEILEIVAKLLRPDGRFYISFGPTWYHPLGGHLFSIFPWAHLVFTEWSLIRWRSDFKTDGATKFSEVAGGLNKMTIARFEKLVKDSPFRAEHLAPVPIRVVAPLHNRFTREFFSAIVRATLVLR